MNVKCFFQSIVRQNIRDRSKRFGMNSLSLLRELHDCRVNIEGVRKFVRHHSLTTNDLDGMVLLIGARKGGRNTEVVKVTAGQSVEVTGGAFVAAVINTNRGANGASLSQRPGICIGTPAEVANCVAALRGTLDAGVDAGVDAGSMEPVDAGPGTDGGVNPPVPPAGCGCGMGSSPVLFLSLAFAWAGRRRWRVHT